MFCAKYYHVLGPLTVGLNGPIQSSYAVLWCNLMFWVDTRILGVFFDQGLRPLLPVPEVHVHLLGLVSKNMGPCE